MNCNKVHSSGAPLALQIKSPKKHSHKKTAVSHVAKKHIKAHKAHAPKKIKATPVKKPNPKSKVHHVAKKHIKAHKTHTSKKIKAKPSKKVPAKSKVHHVAKKHIKIHKPSHKKSPSPAQPRPNAPIPSPVICPGGLLNLGNSCWMNTMIQAIARCPAYNGILNGAINPTTSAQEQTALNNFRKHLLPCVQAVRANAPCPRTDLESCLQTFLEVLRPYENIAHILAQGFDTQTALFYLEQQTGPAPAGFFHQTTLMPGTGLISQEYTMHAGNNHRLSQVVCNTGGHYLLLQREGDAWVKYDDATVQRFASFNAVKPFIDRTGFKLTYVA